MFTKKRLLLAGMLLMFIPTLAGAQTVDTVITGVFQTFNIILVGIQAFLWPILLMLGSLLNNDLLFSGGMQTILLNIWSAVRDFVNILFVLGLLGVAIYNIFGGTKDDFAVKAVLPKIVVALIAVNFSFLICKVTLDAVNVITTSIYAIPLASDSLAKYKDPTQLSELSKKVCDKVAKTPTGQSGTNFLCQPPKGNTGDTNATQIKNELSDLGKTFFTTFGARSAGLIMAVELMDIANIDNVAPGAVDLKSLTINTIFSMIFTIIYGTAFVALFAVMLVRVVVLWISIAISPLTFLGVAFEPVKNSLGDEDPLFKLFFPHAVAPIKVAIVLTIGMIMISQLKQISPGAQFSTDPHSLGAVTSGASTLQDLIAGVATAAFIWLAAFRVLEKTKADFLVGPIKNAVQSFGTSVAKIPLYMPVLPTGSGKVGLAAVPFAMQGPQSWIDKQRSELASKFGNKSEKAVNELKGAKNADEAKTKMANLLNSVPGYSLDQSQKAALAKSIRDFRLLKDGKIIIPPSLKTTYKTDEDFIKALESGDIKAPELEKFYEANRQAGKFAPSNLDTKPAKESAEKAKKEADKVQNKPQALTAAQQSLDTAQKDLETAEKNKNDQQIEQAKTKLEDAAKKLDQMAKAAQEATKGFTPLAGQATYAADGRLIEGSEVLKDARRRFNDAKSAGFNDDEAKKLIEEGFKKSPGSNPANAATNVKIVAGELASAPAAGAATPPAGGPATPGPGTPTPGAPAKP